MANFPESGIQKCGSSNEGKQSPVWYKAVISRLWSWINMGRKERPLSNNFVCVTRVAFWLLIEDNNRIIVYFAHNTLLHYTIHHFFVSSIRFPGNQASFHLPDGMANEQHFLHLLLPAIYLFFYLLRSGVNYPCLFFRLFTRITVFSASKPGNPTSETRPVKGKWLKL